MRNKALENAAQVAAYRIRSALDIQDAPRIGLILGTGWGDVLDLKDAREVPFRELPGFDALGSLEGHRRIVAYGSLGGMPVVALRGRVHLNESHDPDLWKMVRLQTEMLIKLGVKRLVVTCAAGSLPGSHCFPGSVVLIDGFVTVFAPAMPLIAGEFCSPEDAIDRELLDALDGDDPPRQDLPVARGGYAMVRGPFFEGRKYDKEAIAATGASIVGMSTLPEACVAALYPEEGVRVLPLAFISNDAVEAHSHEENVRRAKATAAALGEFLGRTVRLIAERDAS